MNQFIYLTRGHLKEVRVLTACVFNNKANGAVLRHGLLYFKSHCWGVYFRLTAVWR